MVRGIHSRASRWLEEAGDAEASIRHARAAGETGRAAQLVWSQVAHCIDTGQTATLERWIDSFTNTEVVARATQDGLLSLAKLVARVRGGDIDPKDLAIGTAEPIDGLNELEDLGVPVHQGVKRAFADILTRVKQKKNQ